MVDIRPLISVIEYPLKYPFYNTYLCARFLRIHRRTQKPINRKERGEPAFGPEVGILNAQILWQRYKIYPEVTEPYMAGIAGA
jgi:hypothetical protein